MLKIPFSAALLLSSTLAGAPPSLDPTAPPFPKDPVSAHQVTAAVDTASAKGILSLLGGGPQPGATLRELKASPTLARALAAEGINPEDFFGRLVAGAAGTPDPLLASYAARAGTWSGVLAEMDASGGADFGLEARRVLSLFPDAPPMRLKMTLVPFLAVSGFQEVAAHAEGDDWTFVADLPRLAGEASAPAAPREVMLRTIRSAGAVAWRALAAGRLTGPAWKEGAPGVDALLLKTVLEGPPMLLLIPEEFYPLDTLFEEPIARAMQRWSQAVNELSEPGVKETERARVLSLMLTGDFWNRSAAVVGATLTDTLLRKAGRGAYVAALREGPRAVIALWLETTRGTKLPQPSKGARKELVKRLRETAAAAKP